VFSDDELGERLALVLDIAPPAPPADRIAALRARAEAARTRRHRQPTGRWFALAAAVVALLVGAVVMRTVTRDTPDDVEFAGVMVGPDGEPAPADLRVVATGIGRVLDLETEALPILPTGDLYEVWFVGPGDTPERPNRISAGTFHPDEDGRTDVRMTAAVDPSLFPIVEVTAEPGDGDPRATGPVVLRAVVGDYS
jgi:hypothetical protein